MENNTKIALYKERLPVYFILAMSSFQIPFILAYLPTLNETYFYYLMTSNQSFMTILEVGRKYLIPKGVDEIQFLRLFSLIIVAISGLAFYRFCKKQLDFVSSFLAVLIFMVIPVVQFSFLIFLPCSIFVLIGTLSLAMIKSDAKWKLPRMIIVAAVMIALLIASQYIDKTLFIVNIISFFAAWTAYYLVRFFVSISKSWVIYLTALLLILISAYSKAAPIFDLQMPYFSKNPEVIRSLSNSIAPYARIYDTIAMADIKEASSVRYYLRATNAISDIDAQKMGRNSIIVTPTEIDNASSSLPAVYKNLDVVAVYSFSSSSGVRSKYYIYRATY